MLTALGLRRKRRGLLIWDIHSEQVGAVALQHREYPDGALGIIAVAQVYRDPFERLHACGLGAPYKAIAQLSTSRFSDVTEAGAEPVQFHPKNNPAPLFPQQLARVEAFVLPRIRDAAEAEAVEAKYRGDLSQGGHIPASCQCIRTCCQGTLVLDADCAVTDVALESNMPIPQTGQFFRQGWPGSMRGLRRHPTRAQRSHVGKDSVG